MTWMILHNFRLIHNICDTATTQLNASLFLLMLWQTKSYKFHRGRCWGSRLLDFLRFVGKWKMSSEPSKSRPPSSSNGVSSC